MWYKEKDLIVTFMKLVWLELCRLPKKIKRKIHKGMNRQTSCELFMGITTPADKAQQIITYYIHTHTVLGNIIKEVRVQILT